MIGGALKVGKIGLDALFYLMGLSSIYDFGKGMLSKGEEMQAREDRKALATLSESERLTKRMKQKVTLNEGNTQMLESLRMMLSTPGMTPSGFGTGQPGQIAPTAATRAVGLDDGRIAFANALAEQLTPHAKHKPVKATDLLKAAMIPRTGGTYG